MMKSAAIEIVLATDPGVHDVIDFLHQQRRHYDLARHKGFTTAFCVAKNSENNKVVGSIRLDLCTDYDSALTNDFLPAYVRPYYSKLAATLHSPGVAFASNWVLAKDYRGMKEKRVTEAMVVEGISWALSNGSRAMCANSKIRLATIVYSKLGFRPIGGCYYLDNVHDCDNVPDTAVCAVLAMAYSDFKLLPRVAGTYGHCASEVQRKAIEDCFPLFSANQGAEYSIAQQMKQLNASSDGDPFFRGVGNEELTAIFHGAIQFDVRCGLLLLIGRDIKPRDWIFMVSGELHVHSASGDHKFTPGQRVDICALAQPSRVIAAKDSRILMLSPSGVGRIKRTIAQQADQSKPNKLAAADDNYRRLFMSDDAFRVEVTRLQQQAQLFKRLELDILKNAGLRNGAFVADVGCGTGAISITLAQELSETKIVGIDSNVSLLDKGRALSDRLGLALRLTFLRSDVGQMTLQTSSVDFAYARLVMQHIKQPMSVIREMRRAVKPGGKVCVLDIDDSFVALHPTLKGVSSMMHDVAQHQKKTGGDRFVGQKLFHMFKLSDLENVKVHLIPVSSHEISPEGYFQVIYSFRETILEEIGRMDESRRKLFKDLQQLLKKPTTFASTVAFLVEGTVPSPPISRL